jgi:uncharacterized protein YceK
MRKYALSLMVWVAVLGGCSSTMPLGSHQGKTAEHARVEPQRTWHDGWLPRQNAKYPPNQAAPNRNKQRNAREQQDEILLPSRALKSPY